MKQSITYEHIPRIIDLQQQCEQYVLETSVEFLRDLIAKQLLFGVFSSAGILTATAYKKPLNKNLEHNDPNQVFKIGGLALDKKSFSAQKDLIHLLRILTTNILQNNSPIITSTTNPVISKYLINKGNFTELSFLECFLGYSSFLLMFLEQANIIGVPAGEYYKDKKMYVRSKV